MWVSLHCGTASLGKGRISPETVTSDGGHLNPAIFRIQVSLPCDRQRQSMLKLSLSLPLARRPACSNFLAMVWQHAPCLVVCTCLPDQRVLRCMCSGTGAVPTDNVTLSSTKES